MDVERVPGARTPPRRSAGVIVVASAAVVVGAVAIAAGVGAGALWVFEVLTATGLIVGLGAAFGVFERGLPDRRAPHPGGRVAATATVAPALSASVDRQIRALDAVEHRRLDLGSPWPTVVIGPTGVTVIAVADRVDGEHVVRLRRVASRIRRSTRGQPADRPVTVDALLVVPDAEVPGTCNRTGAFAADVRTVALRDLPGAVVRGPILPMTTVTALYSQLTGELAPDLQANAV
jgi:hypothetical protein